MTFNTDRTFLEANTPMAGDARAAALPEARSARDRLGPMLRFGRLDRPVAGRIYAAGVALAAGALLVAAAGLVPSSRHLGTHRQLGLPPCGFVTMTGLPCPTCGMTTAFAHTVRGQFVEAIRSQPAGFLLALGMAGVGLGAGLSAVTGRCPAVNWYRVNPTTLVWWALGLLTASWGAKIVLGLGDGSLPVR